MRVLMVNAFHWLKGGVERTLFDETRWLEAAGHEVAHFATDDPRNDKYGDTKQSLEWVLEDARTALARAERAKDRGDLQLAIDVLRSLGGDLAKVDWE